MAGEDKRDLRMSYPCAAVSCFRRVSGSRTTPTGDSPAPGVMGACDASSMASPASFCAICTEFPPPGTALVQRPLGKGSALVAVCADCDTTHPRSGRYGFSDGRGGGRSGVRSNLGNGNHRTRTR